MWVCLPNEIFFAFISSGWRKNRVCVKGTYSCDRPFILMSLTESSSISSRTSKSRTVAECLRTEIISYNAWDPYIFYSNPCTQAKSPPIVANHPIPESFHPLVLIFSWSMIIGHGLNRYALTNSRRPGRTSRLTAKARPDLLNCLPVICFSSLRAKQKITEFDL